MSNKHLKSATRTPNHVNDKYYDNEHKSANIE